MDNIRLYLLLMLCAVCGVYGGKAQNKISYPHVEAMTPEASSIAKYQDTPVSLYTGTPNISLPLYEIDIDGFKIPLTLRYNASGIKVSQEASWVGLGWTLDIGGRISRSVKNGDDLFDNSYSWDPEHPYFEKGYYYAPDINVEYTTLGGTTVNYPNTYSVVDDPDRPYYETVLANLKLEQRYDSEPDIFYYDLSGLSGKFILDKSRGAVLFDKSHNLSIVPYRDRISHSVFFLLKDGEGNKYIFEDVETTKTYRQKKSLNKNASESNCIYDDNTDTYIQWVDNIFEEPEAAPATPYELATSWCLSEIVTNRNHHIYFTYSEENQYLPTQESCEISNMLSSWNGLYSGYTQKNFYESKILNSARRLTRIDYDNGYVLFTGSNRYDIKTESGSHAKRLDAISIYNKSSKLIRRFAFEYSYFNPNYEGDNYENVFTRLKLDRITDNTIGNPYEFTYFSGILPAKNSKNTDYWGYYNGREYGANYCIGVYCNGEKYSGVKKDANFNYAKIGTLCRIDYPTGGFQEFEYESNKFNTYFYYNTNDDLGNSVNLSPTSTVFNSHTIIELNTYNNAGTNDWAYIDYPSDTTINITIYGSTRLTIGCTLDNVSGLKDNSFNYADYMGQLSRISPSSHVYHIYQEYPLVYEYDGNSGIGSEIEMNTKSYDLEAGTYEFYTGGLPNDVHAAWTLTFDKLYTPGSVNDGTSTPLVEYGGGLRIKKISSTVKTTDYLYSTGTLLVKPILYYTGKKFMNGSLSDCVVQISESITPMSTFNNGYSVGYDYVIESVNDDDNPSYTKYYFKNDSECELVDDNFPDGPVEIVYTNGLLEKREVYDDDNLLLKDEYNYSTTNSQQINAIYDRTGRYLTNENMSYTYRIEWPLLSSDTETLIDTLGQEKITYKTYGYNDKDLMSEVTTSNSDVMYKELVYYPNDVTNSNSVFVSMTDSNIVSLPVEIVRLKNGSVISAEKSLYTTENDMFLISEHDEIASTVVESLSSYNNKYYCKESFDNYDIYGHPQQYSNNEGQIITYLWGYGHNYLIAEIENASYTQVVSCLGGNNAVEQFLSRNSPSDSEVRTFLAPLMNGSISNSMSTIYTYDPLVGMTSKTEATGLTTYYSYDNKNRLSEVKDQDTNIIKKYNYHYKQ